MINKLKGTGIALVTPFSANGAIDFDSLEKLINHCINGGVDYLVTLGNTGESVVLNSQEKQNDATWEETIEFLQKYSNQIKNGEIDLYVDYTGTLINSFKSDERRLKQVLLGQGIVLGPKLGFNNSYGLAVKESSKLAEISDIKASDKIGVSHEFYKRRDGYESLKEFYGFSNKPTAVEHSLLYNSLNSDHLNVIEVYTTDAKIKKNNLRVLKDDKSFFPRYDAVVLVNKNFMEDNKELVKKVFSSIKTKISNDQIMNGRSCDCIN